jgi:hypothetical protein
MAVISTPYNIVPFDASVMGAGLEPTQFRTLLDPDRIVDITTRAGALASVDYTAAFYFANARMWGRVAQYIEAGGYDTVREALANPGFFRLWALALQVSQAWLTSLADLAQIFDAHDLDVSAADRMSGPFSGFNLRAIREGVLVLPSGQEVPEYARTLIDTPFGSVDQRMVETKFYDPRQWAEWAQRQMQYTQDWASQTIEGGDATTAFYPGTMGLPLAALAPLLVPVAKVWIITVGAVIVSYMFTADRSAQRDHERAQLDHYRDADNQMPAAIEEMAAARRSGDPIRIEAAEANLRRLTERTRIEGRIAQDIADNEDDDRWLDDLKKIAMFGIGGVVVFKALDLLKDSEVLQR